jgi:PAS domain S-box-containing protein
MSRQGLDNLRKKIVYWATGPSWLRYVVAIVIVVVAVAVRLKFLQTIGTGNVFLTLYPAVTIAALYGGLYPGLLATVLSALSANYFWIGPVKSIFIQNPADWLSLAIFLINCTMISFITEAMHSALTRANEAETEAKLAAERKRSQEELQRLLTSTQEEKDRLSSLISSISDEVWFADAQKRFTLANPSALRAFGLDVSDGIDIEKLVMSLEVYRPDGSPRPVEEAPPLRALKGEVVRSQEEIVRTPASAELRYRQVSSTPVRDATGNVIGSVSVVRDITELKLVEQALKESEDRFRSLFENLLDAFCYCKMIFDDEGRPIDYIYLEANSAFETMSGFVNVVGKKVTEVIPGVREAHPEMFEAYGRVAMTGHPEKFEIHFAPTGRWFNVSAYSTKKGYVAIIFDNVTERKRAEEQFQAYRRLLETVVNHIPVAVNLIRGKDLRVQLVNAAYQAIAPGKEIVGKTLDELRPETGQNFSELCRRVLETGNPYHAEDELNMIRRWPDGPLERAYFSWSLHRVQLPGDEGWGILNTAWETTDRKQAEEAILRSHAELEKRVKERTRKLADSQEQLRNLYSHLQTLREEERTNIAREIHDDLGQALTALKMDLSLIAARLRDDEEGLKERLNADVDQVDKTIDAVKRVCTELRPGILDDLGIAAAIEWQAEDFQRRTGIKCEVVFDPEDIVVDADLSTPLFRIFQEALTNVLKHAKATEVKASFRQTSSSIILEIADNGIGITEEELSKPNSFGLLGMRERVYPWEGKVTVSGVKNKGTTVEVIIPVTTGEPS